MRTGAFLQPFVAFFGEHAVAGEVAIVMSLSHIPEFAARHVGFIKGNVHEKSPVLLR